MKKYRKIGNIICDPNCEEAKSLVGKMVAYGDVYSNLLTRIKEGKVSMLDGITDNEFRPFFIEDFNTSWGMICAVEEVPEETKYRPYTLEEAVRLIGRVFRLKHIEDNDEITCDSVGYVSKTSEGDLIINNIAVEDFMERYEWYDPETGNTEPIGVEVEEWMY